MSAKTVILAAFFLLVYPLSTQTKEPPAKRGPADVLLGYVDKGAVFALDLFPDTKDKIHRVDLLKGSLNADPSRNVLSKKYQGFTPYLAELPYRWRLAHGCFWGIGYPVMFGTKVQRVPERPLGVVITETATNKSFGFASPDKGGQAKEKPVYFEFSGKLDPQAYDPKKFESLKAEEPLKTVMEHARFLWKENKIKE